MQFDIAYFSDLLAVDTQHRDAAVALVKIGAFVVGTGQDHHDSHVALRVSLPKFRFVRIDGVARRGSDTQQCLRTSRSDVCRASPPQARRSA